MGTYLRPCGLDAALAALASGPRTILAGGTDIFPAHVGGASAQDILDISALPGLRQIGVFRDHVWIPALATWTDVIAAGLPSPCDALARAARQVGGPQIQNQGTVVGNLVNASPAADGFPCLLAADAEVEIASAHHRRRVKVDDFVTGARRTILRPDEMVLGLRVPRDPAPVRARFEKLGARRYLVISIVIVAAVARFSQDGSIASARIAVGACGARARKLPALEAALRGRFPDPALVQPEYLGPLAPIDDIRGSAAYRHAAALELARRAVAGLAAPEARAA